MLGLETALSVVAGDARAPGCSTGAGRRPDVGRAGRIGGCAPPPLAGRAGLAHAGRPGRAWVAGPGRVGLRSRNTPYADASCPAGWSRRSCAASRPCWTGRRSGDGSLLVLEDGRTFRGEAFGAVGESVGEAVFATGMTGYQETLTDPSYHRQVVVMTAPHVGNTGINDEDAESGRVQVPGTWSATRPAAVLVAVDRSLPDELERAGVVGVSGVDTRALTRHLRERGAMRVGLSSVESDPRGAAGRVRRRRDARRRPGPRGVHPGAVRGAGGGPKRAVVARSTSASSG
jgi:hypothetical protein